MPDGSPDAAVLRIEGVTKRFGGLVAVNNMSFALSKNEVLGLIGPNGSGKTTMLNMISGALKPTSGTILLHGKDISTAPASEIAVRGIARTFQIVRMLPSLTVLENVAAGGVFGHSRRWGRELDNYARDRFARGALDIRHTFGNGIQLRSLSGAQYINTYIRNDDDGSLDRMAVYVAPTDLTDADVVCHEGRRIVFVDPGEVAGLRLTKGAGVILPAFLLSDVYRAMVAHDVGH